MIEMFHPVGHMTLVEDRAAYLLSMAKGKSVLHLGCVDAGLTAERMKKGELLHVRLGAVARRLVGIDVDVDGIRLLRQLGVGDLIAGDLQKDCALQERFDLVIAGEILEHLDSPGMFLTNVSRYLNSRGELVISVPNAYSLLHALRMARGIEAVHEDHVAYYSPNTLRRLLSRHGFEVMAIMGYSEAKRLGAGLRVLKLGLNRTLFRLCPQLAEGLVLVCRWSGVA